MFCDLCKGRHITGGATQKNYNYSERKCRTIHIPISPWVHLDVSMHAHALFFAYLVKIKIGKLTVPLSRQRANFMINPVTVHVLFLFIILPKGSNLEWMSYSAQWPTNSNLWVICPVKKIYLCNQKMNDALISSFLWTGKVHGPSKKSGKWLDKICCKCIIIQKTLKEHYSCFRKFTVQGEMHHMAFNT